MQVVPSYHALFVMQEAKESRALSCLLESKKRKQLFTPLGQWDEGDASGAFALKAKTMQGSWRLSISTLYLWVESTKAVNISRVVDTSRFVRGIYKWIRSKQVAFLYFHENWVRTKRPVTLSGIRRFQRVFCTRWKSSNEVDIRRLIATTPQGAPREWR